MNIAIIGHGNVGGALAKAWANAGHDVVIGARDPESEKVKALTAHDHIAASSIEEAVKNAEVILVATPPQVATELSKQFGEVKGKTIIDATNAVRSKPDNYPTAFHAFAVLTNAEMVKCFNSTGFENMANPKYGAIKLDMFMAGDSKSAKEVARALAKDVGFEDCIDFGGSDRVELLEQFALSWINLAIMQGHGRNIGFKVFRRP